MVRTASVWSWCFAGFGFIAISTYAVEPSSASPRPPQLPVVGEHQKTPEFKLLAQWWAEGTAAGNTGDGYQNMDGGHSRLDLKMLPQITAITPQRPQSKATPTVDDDGDLGKVETGANDSVSVVVGNSSTRGPRSHSLNLVAERNGFLQAYKEYYRGNKLIIIPSVADYHAQSEGIQGIGDVYAAQCPYLITSQGASGTDQPFVRAAFLTLASFRPEVKKELVKTGLVMPAFQWCLRQSFMNVKTRDDFLTWRAHGPVMVGRRDPGQLYDMGFRAAYPRGDMNIDYVKMVTLAHNLTPDTIPPLIQLRIEEEDFSGNPGEGHCDAGLSERLQDSPCAIARVLRTAAFKRRMVVNVRETINPGQRPLRYRWVLLQGDPTKVNISPLDVFGSRAEIQVEYFEKFKIHEGSEIVSCRADIGVFAEDGQTLSVPGFISFYTIPFECRTYGAQGRLKELAYGIGETGIGSPLAPVGTKFGKGAERDVLSENEGRGYPIFSWSKAFRFIGGEGDETARNLLKKRFTDPQWAALAKYGAEFVPLQEKRLDIVRSAERNGKLETEVRNCETAVKTAQVALDKHLNAENEQILKEARARLDEALRKQDEAKAQAADSKPEAAGKGKSPTLNAALETVANLLTAERPELGGSLKSALEAALTAITEDLDFFLSNQADIEKMAAAIPAARRGAKSRYDSAVKALVDMGLLHLKDGAYVLTPALQGAEPASQRLTRYEKFFLRRLNGEILSTVVFPAFLNKPFEPYYTDPRISVMKNWRDIFHYDAKGELTGWTRYGAGKTAEFAANGDLIVERDATGKPVKVQPVRYELAAKPLLQGRKGLRGDALCDMSAWLMGWKPADTGPAK